jgi:hypothetical protein
MTSLLRRLLTLRTVSVRTFGTHGQWGEIDNPGDVAVYQSMLRASELVLEEAMTDRRP